MVTYAVIGLFVAMSLSLVFGHSHLMQLQSEMVRAREETDRGAANAGDAAYIAARDRYNRTVTTFPMNLIAAITGFAKSD